MNTDVLIKNALNDIEKLLISYKNSDLPKDKKKADLLAYWLTDYCKMLKKESTFDSTKLKRYKRGEIVKVHLGYNIGSEEGGLHYAVVLDKNNSPSNPTITIVPLTSIKPNTNVENLHPSKVFLGDYIYYSLKKKLTAQEQEITVLTNSVMSKISELKQATDSSSDDELLSKKELFVKELEDAYTESLELNKQKEANKKIQKEIAKMKTGSIALISQITTVSKIRIYAPLHSDSALSNIRLTPQLLDLIDEKIYQFYIGHE